MPGRTTRSSFSSSISSRSARSLGVSSSGGRSSSTYRDATVSSVELKVRRRSAEPCPRLSPESGLQPAFRSLRSASSMRAVRAFVPGLTRRLLLAVLAALVPAVAASPAGATGHSSHPPVKARPNVGIVDIYTTLGYENGLAAGTGMIVTPSGEVLTNNHVIAGATKFKVVDVTTHRRYASDGHRLLRLARHRRPPAGARLGSADRQARRRHSPARRDAGRRPRERAGSCGGPPKTARGRIIALHQQIVATDETGDSETLNNVIATNARSCRATPAARSRTPRIASSAS